MTKLIDSFLSADFDDYDSLLKSYTIIYISYFDHFLDGEEYSNAELICYKDAQGDSEKEKLFRMIEDRFIELYRTLYYWANEKVIIYVGGNEFEPSSYSEYNNFIINAMKENPLCQILYPLLGMFSVTGYDLTHQLFFLKENENEKILVQERIENLVNNTGLHIIS